MNYGNAVVIRGQLMECRPLTTKKDNSVWAHRVKVAELGLAHECMVMSDDDPKGLLTKKLIESEGKEVVLVGEVRQNFRKQTDTVITDCFDGQPSSQEVMQSMKVFAKTTPATGKAA